ncbi:MAG: CDP-alcohol phosphatidyltransferase family protein [Chloroflexi bacterium]|nr:MAG: CDP-alcohol phosphatidyltransferase family protein [Chloroflexota bacterium]
MFANAITISRLGFLGLCLLLLYQPGGTAKVIAFALVIFIVFLDGIDGIIARRRGEASALGSVLDIAIDRVVENVFWIAFVDLDLVPVWIALIVVTRGILTDAVRGFALARGMTAFEMMRTDWGRRLVSSRFMRALYGFAKVTVFAALVAVYALQELWAGTPDAHRLPPLETAVFGLVLLTVGLTVIRGLPVLIESRRFFHEPTLP